jgi:hypothetical protein
MYSNDDYRSPKNSTKMSEIANEDLQNGLDIKYSQIKNNINNSLKKKHMQG